MEIINESKFIRCLEIYTVIYLPSSIKDLSGQPKMHSNTLNINSQRLRIYIKREEQDRIIQMRNCHRFSVM